MAKPLDLLSRLKAFEAANPSKRGPLCSVCRLPESVKQVIKEARAEGITLRTLSKVLALEGHKVGEYSIGRHLRDEHGA